MKSNKTKDYTSFNGMVVKLQERTYNNKVRTLITSFLQEETGFWMGHPYDVDEKRIYCGRSFSPFIEEIIDISPISKDEYEFWKKKYDEYHSDIVSRGGYDSCEENIKSLVPYYSEKDSEKDS